MKSINLVAVLSLGLLAVVPKAEAVLLLAEDFSGTGNTIGLEYMDLGSGITIGGADANGARSEGLGFGSATTQFYALASSVNTGTAYFSLLYRQPSPSNWGGFSFYEGGSEELFFGDPGLPFSGSFGIDRNGGSPPSADLSSVSISAGVTYFLVGAYDFDAGIASVWIDPPFGGAMPVADLAVAFPSGWTLTQVRTGAEAPTHFDRIRVGTMWGDVVPDTEVPVPEPSTFVLVLTFTGLLAGRRRVSSRRR